MPKSNKGKPSGKFAESKTDPGRKGNYKRSGWPEEARTLHAKEPGQQSIEKPGIASLGGERNRKAGGDTK